MTNEELIQTFPECEKIKCEDIAECVTKAMDEERFYRSAVDAVYKKTHELWPYKGPYDENNAEQNAYRSYFHGDPYGTGAKSPFRKWLDKVEQVFLCRHGNVHTFEEACQIAADEWMRLIFGNHMQNNGDQSQTGALAMIFGTMVKKEASGRYGDDVVEKARKMMNDFYFGGVHRG